MLIATLPKIHEVDLMEKIISHPLICAVRYNTGYYSPYSATETLKRITFLTEKYKKKLWIDLEGRQLRVAEWSYPVLGGPVILNREIKIIGPAQINFRRDPKWYNVCGTGGREVFLDQMPTSAIGRGQTVNILGKNVIVPGAYLIGNDHEFIHAACELGVFNFMLSFFEKIIDAYEVVKIAVGSGASKEQLDLCLKIESLKGYKIICGLPSSFFQKKHLMAACDDLFTNLHGATQKSILLLKKIIEHDSEAIRASKIFSGLEKDGFVNLSEWSDLYLMRQLGYQHFMLSDGICQYYFDAAIQAWHDFYSLYSFNSLKRR